MRFILGLLVFWLTVFTTKYFLENKFKIPKSFSLPLTFTLIGIYEFILGILNLMLIGSIIYILFSLGNLVFLIINKKLDYKELFKEFKNPLNLICCIVFIYITFVGINMHLMHYDNFSHWGLIVKDMFINNRFPTFEEPFITFKGYQPGGACFIYFFGLLCGKTEGVMIIAQNYLIFSYLTILLKSIKNNKFFSILTIVCFYIFVLTTSLINFNNLSVDSLISLMALCCLIIIYKYQDNLKKAFLYTLPIIIYLLLVKNMGLILDGFICLYLLYIGYKNKKLKLSIKYVFIIGMLILAVLLIWQEHVSLVYGHWALNTKHSLSPQNIYSSVKSIGLNNIINFIILYLKNLVTLKNNLPNIYLLILNLLIILIIFLKKERKNLIKFLLLINSIYLGYYLILGLMYILSMPWEEARVLAGYERYMMSIVYILVGLFLYYILDRNLKYQNIYLFLISIVLLIPISFRNDAFESILGKDYYKYSNIEKLDTIIEKVPKDKDNYYIYSPSSKSDLGYLKFIAVYKLFNGNVEIITSIKDLENIYPNSYLIILDEIDNKNLKKFKYFNDKVYIKDA